jgi:hypothetical protein
VQVKAACEWLSEKLKAAEAEDAAPKVVLYGHHVDVMNEIQASVEVLLRDLGHGHDPPLGYAERAGSKDKVESDHLAFSPTRVQIHSH